MAVGISDPSVVVNNLSVAIAANTLVYTEGFGERNVRTQTAGNGSVGIVSTEDAETRASKAEFGLIPTAENIALIRQWLANLNSNAITFFQGGFNRTITQATIVNNPDMALGADTIITVEFMGAPAV